MVKLFGGNLSYDVEEAELKALLERVGRVRDVYAPLDRVTQRRRGFAMVEVLTDADAKDIIRELNGYPPARTSDARRLRPGTGGRGSAGQGPLPVPAETAAAAA